MHQELGFDLDEATMYGKLLRSHDFELPESILFLGHDELEILFNHVVMLSEKASARIMEAWWMFQNP